MYVLYALYTFYLHKSLFFSRSIVFQFYTYLQRLSKFVRGSFVQLPRKPILIEFQREPNPFQPFRTYILRDRFESLNRSLQHTIDVKESNYIW